MESGKEETLRFGFRWKVTARGPMTTRDWTRWEIERARELLDRAARALDGRGEDSTVLELEDLGDAVTHAVWAWCRTHLRPASAVQDEFSVISQ